MTAQQSYPVLPGYTTPEIIYPRLHPTGRPGHVTIARRDGQSWYENTIPVAELPDAIPALVGRDDVYVTTQRFFGRRRIAALAECGTLHVDVDFYTRPELRNLAPLAVLDAVLTLLADEKKPAPSIAIASGRGLYLWWLHSPIPRKALPRWNACQRELWTVLAPFGADRRALDAARVLRIVGSRHSKKNVTVEAITPVGEVWDFDALADEVLPMSRAELVDLRAERGARLRSKRLDGTPEGYGSATLWATRLDDLQKLRDLRWFGQPLPDYRDRWLFAAGVGMSWLSPPPVLQRELFALAAEIGGWTEGRTRSKLHAIFRTSRAAARGERVEWSGELVDPRYRFRSETIIEDLEITADEQAFMSTLIDDDERRKRNRERKRQERRQAGMMSREDYEAAARERRIVVGALRDKGMTYRSISATTGIALSEVHRLTKTRIDKPCSECVPVYGGVSPVEDRHREGFLGSGEVSGEPHDEGERSEHSQSCLCEICLPIGPPTKYARPWGSA